MGIREDVIDDAVSFLLDHEDIFVQALVGGVTEGREVDYDDSGEFCEIVVDRSYTLEYAVHVILHCDNEETDCVLWEGQQPEDAICTKAAFSYANDVREALHGLYEELVGYYDEALEALQESSKKLEELRAKDGFTPEQEKELAALEDCEKLAAAEAMKRFREENCAALSSAEPGSDEEARILERWLALNANAGMWGGYPLGSSYIDARCGTGYGMPEIKEFVDFDHEAARRLPHLAGKHRHEIKAYFQSRG